MTELVKCVVCNRSTEKTKAITAMHQGQNFSVCSTGCVSKFNMNPTRYARSMKSTVTPKTPTTPSGSTPSTSTPSSSTPKL